MFFIASKIFWFVAEPLSLAIALGLLGILLGFTRFARAGRALMAGAIVALAACLFTPLGALLMRPLEDRFPRPPADIPAPAGIIVLGGDNDTDSDARMITGAELARRYPTARLVLTGGSASSLGEGRAEAIGARPLWLSLGVPEKRMTFEEKSRNTWENGLFTRDLVKPKRGETWFLVTSAWHMPRSVGIFRHLGFDVTPYPVAYATFGDERDFLPPTSILYTSMSDKVFTLDYSVREWAGLLAYRLAGKTDALFPAP
jgi:uncharacterized SAM-binding protein YcdF (DUF218 family)